MSFFILAGGEEAQSYINMYLAVASGFTGLLQWEPAWTAATHTVFLGRAYVEPAAPTGPVDFFFCGPFRPQYGGIL